MSYSIQRNHQDKHELKLALGGEMSNIVARCPEHRFDVPIVMEAAERFIDAFDQPANTGIGCSISGSVDLNENRATITVFRYPTD